jgi:hypothetical protein
MVIAAISAIPGSGRPPEPSANDSRELEQKPSTGLESAVLLQLSSSLFDVSSSALWRIQLLPGHPIYGLRIYEVNVNIKINRMRNGPSKPCGPNTENLTGCLQRYVVLGYGRKRKKCTLHSKQQGVINDFQVAEFDFHQRNPDIHVFIFSNSIIIKSVHFNHSWNIHNSTE